MALRLIRRIVMGAVLIVVLVTPSAVYTCGPYLESAAFVLAEGPQVSQADFVGGKMGILLPTFSRSYLIVAYRYLNGLKLDDEQRQDAVDVWNRRVGPNPQGNDRSAIEAWNEARGQVSGLPAGPDYEAYAPVSLEQSYQSFLNCPNEAFKNAISTLQERVKKYSAGSSVVRDWITAQDQVFSNCDSKAQMIPAVLNSADSLVRSDRAYQIAAAQFYARSFDNAIASFEGIARDSSSPWSGISSYLAARAVIRKANLATSEYNKFDVPSMKTAQQRLEQILQNPGATAVHEPARRLLEYVRFRTEPAKRVAELEQLMLKADPGPEFRQHFWDYVLLVTLGEQAGDLSDWLGTFHADWTGDPAGTYSRPDVKSAAEHAVAKWRELHSLTWLIAALQLADAKEQQTDDMLKAARQVPVASPAYLTVRYLAVRLMLNRKEEDGARKELDALLTRTTTDPSDDLSPGTRNLFNDERQKLAVSLSDFLAHAAETPEWVGFDYGDIGGSIEDEDKDDAGKPKAAAEKAYFNAYSAQILARRLPLARLVESAQSTALPSHLRREIARSAWVRAVLAGDFAVAEKLQPVLQELDNPLWKAMASFRSASSDSEKRFAAAFVILQNPGLKPSVREGLLRSATLGEIDNYRDNWWCDDLGAGIGTTAQRQYPEFSFPSFVADADRNATKQEFEKFASNGFAPNYLTSAVLAFAKEHPDDPRIPQALHLAVRATRYGCTNPETTHLSETAFTLLHRRYPKSEWAEKTKYHY
jgi:hypothetical protein